jgi:hypothetical protein
MPVDRRPGTCRLAMEVRRPLLGEQPDARYRVWYHNAEDDTEEINRRIAATCQHYGLSMSELEGWLFCTSGVDRPISCLVCQRSRSDTRRSRERCD